MYGVEIDITDDNAERDYNVSDGEKDVDWYAIQVSGSSEADKWKSDKSDGDNNED